MNVYILIYILSLLSCHAQTQECIKEKQYKKILFLDDKVSIKVPHDWSMVDSNLFNDISLVYRRNISNADTSNFIDIAVNDYGIYNRNIKLEFEEQSAKYKSMIQQLSRVHRDSVKAEIKILGDRKVSFAKALNRTNKKMSTCIGHIYYQVAIDKQVVILVRVKDVDAKSAEQRMDCILNSFTISK